MLARSAPGPPLDLQALRASVQLSLSGPDSMANTPKHLLVTKDTDVYLYQEPL